MRCGMTIEQTADKLKTRAIAELKIRPKLHGSLKFSFKGGKLTHSKSDHGDGQCEVESTVRE